MRTYETPVLIKREALETITRSKEVQRGRILLSARSSKSNPTCLLRTFPGAHAPGTFA